MVRQQQCQALQMGLSGFEKTVRLILILAVLLATTHIIEALLSTKFSPCWERWLFFAGIFLPICGAALVGFQSLLELERRGRSYAYNSQRLEHFASQLRTLLFELGPRKIQTAKNTISSSCALCLPGRGSVFSEELLQWRLVMEPRMLAPNGLAFTCSKEVAA